MSRPAPSCLALALLLWPAAARAQTTGPATPARPGITLELNKLEAAPGGCRAYFVAENRFEEPVRELRLDTYIFDASGGITQRFGLTFPDLRPGRPRVVPFELTGSPCEGIGRLLVNDVLACTDAGGSAIAGCGERLVVSTRTKSAFQY